MAVSAQGTSSRLMGRALLASLVIHALAITLIPALSWTPTSGATVETITFTRIAHIEIEPRRVTQPPPRAAAQHRSTVVVVAHASRRELQHVTHHRAASPPPAVAEKIASAPTVAASPKAGVESGNGDAVPRTAATPVQRAVASAVGHNTGGYLPFGAELPVPVLDPGVVKQLTSLGVHVTLIVTVGDDGKTKNIVFQPPVDEQTKTRIESLLADASWDPAVCGGGISCQGQATIKL
jgi:hypothetical protein